MFSFLCVAVLLPVSRGIPIEAAVNASQSPDSPDPPSVGFVSDPDGRGTLGLLFSCLLTLVLCVWSALHLNVPKQKDFGRELPLYARWIFTGIFAPELVAFTAWRQWRSAKLLTKVVQDTLPSHPRRISASSPPKETSDEAHTPKVLAEGNGVFKDARQSSTLRVRDGTPDDVRRLSASTANEGSLEDPADKTKSHGNPWTLTHGFFASSGGFAFDIDEDDNEHWLPPNAPKRLFLTARGVALLARCGRLPEVTEAEIWDKSKANGLAKTLILLQAAWMFIQVIARLAVRLPVTLLEINTIAHVYVIFV